MYGEDLDWCYRIQQAGWRIHYTPATQIIHYKGESTKKGDLRYVLLFYGAMLRFVEKHVRRPDAGRGERLASQPARRRACGPASSRGRRWPRSGASGGPGGARRWTLCSRGPRSRPPHALWSTPTASVLDASYYGLVLPVYAAALALAVRLAGDAEREPLACRRDGDGSGPCSSSPRRRSSCRRSRSAGPTSSSATPPPPCCSPACGCCAAREGGTRRVLVVGSAAEAARLKRLVDVPGRSPSTSSATSPSAPRRASRTRRRTPGCRARSATSHASTAPTRSSSRRTASPTRPSSTGCVRCATCRSTSRSWPPAATASSARRPSRTSRRRCWTPSAPWRRCAAAAGRSRCPSRSCCSCCCPSCASRRGSRRASRAPPASRHRCRPSSQGATALVGYDPGQPHPPDAWGLAPGVVSILDTLAAPPATIAEAHRAYWFYARYQSAGLDLQVLRKAIAR